MSPAEFRELMLDYEQWGDLEIAHGMADDLMCQILQELGYGEGVDIFKRMDKWYA